MKSSTLINSIAAAGVSLTMAGCSSSSLKTDAINTAHISPSAVNTLSQSIASLAIFGVKADAPTTSQPIGAYDFCQTASNCLSLSSLRKTFKSTPDYKPTQAELSALSRDINAKYAAANDKEIYGKDEVWAYPVDKADCEDYALAKRKVLLTRGIMPEDLSMAVVRQKNGEGHAVLLVDTGDDVYVLDNLVNGARTFGEATQSYKFIKWSSDLKKWSNFETEIVTPKMTASP